MQWQLKESITVLKEIFRTIVGLGIMKNVRFSLQCLTS